MVQSRGRLHLIYLFITLDVCSDADGEQLLTEEDEKHLLASIAKQRLPGLSTEQEEHLRVLIQTVLEVSGYVYAY